jgi:hypothetical protein
MEIPHSLFAMATGGHTAVVDTGGQLLLSCDPPLKVSYLAQQILTPVFFGLMPSGSYLAFSYCC